MNVYLSNTIANWNVGMKSDQLQIQESW